MFPRFEHVPGTLLPATLSLASGSVVRFMEELYGSTARWAGFTEHMVRRRPDAVHLWMGGEGPPVLLLSGFGAPALFQWHEQFAALARTHRVLAPDLLWFGKSHSDSPDPSLEHQTGAMVRLLDALELNTVRVVGLSYGGVVAHLLALQHPQRVERLVLADTPGVTWTGADFRAMLQRLGAQRGAELFVPKDAAGMQRLNRLAFMDPPYLPAWAAAQAVEAFYGEHRALQVAQIQWMEDYLNRTSQPRLGAVSMPTLVVWGRDDPIFPLAVGERLRQELAAPLVVLNRARHLANVDRSRAFNRAVLKFLRQ